MGQSGHSSAFVYIVNTEQENGDLCTVVNKWLNPHSTKGLPQKKGHSLKNK